MDLEKFEEEIGKLLESYNIHLALILFREGTGLHSLGFASNDADGAAVMVMTEVAAEAMEEAKPLINKAMVSNLSDRN